MASLLAEARTALLRPHLRTSLLPSFVSFCFPSVSFHPFSWSLYFWVLYHSFPFPVFPPFQHIALFLCHLPHDLSACTLSPAPLGTHGVTAEIQHPELGYNRFQIALGHRRVNSGKFMKFRLKDWNSFANGAKTLLRCIRAAR